MSGLTDYGCTGTLYIGGVLMNCPAWDIVDLMPLWAPSIALRGDDVVIPFRAGRVPVPRWRDSITVSLNMLISGEVDRGGGIQTNVLAGLRTNLKYLYDNVTVPINDATSGVRDSVLHVPGGETLTADVYCKLTPGQHLNGRMFATLDLTIPAGVYA